MSKHFEVKKSKKQKIWTYMGRNRLFRAGDIVSIFDVNLNTLDSLLWTYRKIGYIKLVKKTKLRADRVYRVVKYTGVQSPSISGLKVHDHNIEESFTIPKRPSVNDICRAFLTIRKQPFSLRDIQSQIGKDNYRRVYIVSRILRKKEVLVVDSVGKGGKLHFKISADYRDVLSEKTIIGGVDD